jgi:hypothetical protein
LAFTVFEPNNLIETDIIRPVRGGRRPIKCFFGRENICERLEK